MTVAKVVSGAVVAVAVMLAALILMHGGKAAAGGDQCAKPVSERTGGWVCYEPDPH